MRILVFGDSIAYGAWDTKGGWVDRLKCFAHEQTVKSKGNKKLQIINLGIGSDTSSKILARLETEIKARISVNWPLILIFNFGINDERTINNVAETSLCDFKENIVRIIEISNKYTTKIVFLGIPPIGQEKVLFKGSAYSNNHIKIYNQELIKIVKDYNLQFIPLISKFEQEKSNDLFSYDLLHPNNLGHQLIANCVMDAVNNFQK